MLYIDKNDTNNLRFHNEPTYYSQQYDVDGRLTAKMLAVQNILDSVKAAFRRLTEGMITQAEYTSILENVWVEVNATVLRFDGASVETKPSKKATAAVTNSP